MVQGDAPVDVGKEHTREHTKEHTKTKNPPAAADAETDSRLAQTTIDGTEEPIKSGAREETDEDRAFGIANGWVGYRRQQGVPVAPANRAVHLIKSLSLPFLATGYTVNEIKNALARIGEGVPSKGQLQRELERGRTGRGNGGAVRQGRRSGADVESSWADVRPAKSDAAPAFADSSSGGSRW